MPWGRGRTPTRRSASVDLHEYLGLPTDEPSTNVTRSRLGRPVHQGLLEQPARGISETDLTPSEYAVLRTVPLQVSGDTKVAGVGPSGRTVMPYTAFLGVE